MLLLPYISTFSYGGVGGPRKYYDYGALNRFKILGNMTDIAVGVFALLLLGQLIYFANLFVGLYKGVDRKNNC